MRNGEWGPAVARGYGGRAGGSLARDKTAWEEGMTVQKTVPILGMMLRCGFPPMSHEPGPKKSIEQQKQLHATARRRLLYVAAAGGVLMIPLSLALIPPFIPEGDKWDLFEDHFGLCAALGMIGASLLGAGLSWAGHFRKQYEQLEQEEAATREAGANVAHDPASSDQ